MFKRILVANRGEIALRIIRACHELEIEAAVVYSEADGKSLAVRMADQAICIGGDSPKQSYLHYQNILSAAEISGSEAIHPGYGFLAENAAFVEACEALDLVFIGPSRSIIKCMGDKTKARSTMKQAGIPIVPGSEDLIRSEDDLRGQISEIGFPVLLKASGGGGGRGMRLIRNEKDISSAYHQAVAEAAAAFSDDRIYLEKFIENPKHIEVQILGDRHGNCIHLFERDCSVQRRHQKLIEESPAPGLSPGVREAICGEALSAARHIGYDSVGTVEFLLEPVGGTFYFMEMNTRIQVEHPVTESVTGVDLIKEQIRVAAGQPLRFTQEEIHSSGHAIECRINAEDGRQGFRPTPGKISRLIFPGGPGIRIDSAMESGSEISPHYDSMIAKVIAHGGDRREALARMKRALREFNVDGVPTTLDSCRKILKHEDFVSGAYSTHFLDRLITEGNHV